jgi:hypothetical protein
MGTQPTSFGGFTGGSSVVTPQTTQSLNNANFRERVAKRAYEKWMKRGCKDGYAQQDWLEAERELLAEQARLSTQR